MDFKNVSALNRVECPSSSSTPPCLVKAALLNARSVNNKAVLLSDIIIEEEIDLVCLTETWHKQCDGVLFNELTPTGYGLLEIPRATGRGGGIIVLYNSYININPVVIPHFNSFECLALSVSAPISTVIVTVYRPPKSKGDFLTEFADLLSLVCVKFERILILGDFNIHIDKNDSTMTRDFLSLLDCFDLKQLVDCPTHIKGHTLDLVITNGTFLSQLSSSDFGLSDHLAILFNVDLSHLNMPLSRTVNYRKWKSIDVPDFSAFVDSSLSYFLPSGGQNFGKPPKSKMHDYMVSWLCNQKMSL